MSTEATERRLSPRIPFRADLQVLFERSEAAIPAQAGNISAAGMEFRIPWHKGEQSRGMGARGTRVLWRTVLQEPVRRAWKRTWGEATP